MIPFPSIIIIYTQGDAFSLYFLNTLPKQGVTELSHLATLSSHFLRDNVPKSRQNRHSLMANTPKLPQNNS